MRKEIGSVLEFEEIERYASVDLKRKFVLPFMEKSQEYKTFFYQNGRNAVEKLLNVLKTQQGIDRIALPEFVCDVVKEAIIRAGVELVEYEIHQDCSMECMQIEKMIEEGISCVYIVHYWGRNLNESERAMIQRWKSQGIIIVEDITLSLYSKGKDNFGFGDYILGSLRKWLPIPDGAFISTKKLLPQLEAKNSDTSEYTYFYTITQMLKRKYIQDGCVDKNLKRVYMDYYHRSTKANFSDFTIRDMSKVSQYYLENYNQDSVISKRVRNYNYLYEHLKGLDSFEFPVVRGDGGVPFGFFCLCSDRDSLLEYLIAEDIYCNVHWNFHRDDLGKISRVFQQQAITIPIDQRYDIQDMEYICKKIYQWYNNKNSKKVNL